MHRNFLNQKKNWPLQEKNPIRGFYLKKIGSIEDILYNNEK
jgi:hypothetical protein